MKVEQLMDALNCLDDDLIEAVEPLRRRKNRILSLVLPVAACLCLVVLSANRLIANDTDLSLYNSMALEAAEAPQAHQSAEEVADELINTVTLEITQLQENALLGQVTQDTGLLKQGQSVTIYCSLEQMTELKPGMTVNIQYTEDCGSLYAVSVEITAH